jgi:hypothetical protein
MVVEDDLWIIVNAREFRIDFGALCRYFKKKKKESFFKDLSNYDILTFFYSF